MAERKIIEQLQQQILSMEGNRQLAGQQAKLGLGELEMAFHGRVFPRGVIHEFISDTAEQAACTSGFIGVVLARLMQQNGCCMWISARPRRALFPSALPFFGIAPERILFVDTSTPKETLWALEEALKCEALTAVVGELSELSFNDSRRLQLAVEKSHVTGFIHRFRPKTENAVACVSRFRVSPLPSEPADGLPGVGFPRWNVRLLKARNGKPGEWQVQWSPAGLAYTSPHMVQPSIEERRAG